MCVCGGGCHQGYCWALHPGDGVCAERMHGVGLGWWGGADGDSFSVSVCPKDPPRHHHHSNLGHQPLTYHTMNSSRGLPSRSKPKKDVHTYTRPQETAWNRPLEKMNLPLENRGGGWGWFLRSAPAKRHNW